MKDDYKRIIKRSTIPLIEFKQMMPNNRSSKYLIFERINTGSEKLTPMQIRKSLAYGSYIKELYCLSEKEKDFNKLFSFNLIKKDANVEALLRVFVAYQYNSKKYKIEKQGLKNILNDFCENNKDGTISEDL